MSIGPAECKKGMALLASPDVPDTLLNPGIRSEAEERESIQMDRV